MAALSLPEFLNPDTLLGAVIYALIIGALAWFVGRLVRLAVGRALDGSTHVSDRTAVRFLGQLARLAVYILAILSYVHIIPALRHLGTVWLTSVGVVSVVVGLAAQNTLGNLISGISLLLYRPFQVGDRVQVMAPTGLESGTVESLSLGYTSVRTDDQRLILIPNSTMASQTSINASLAGQRVACLMSVTVGNGAEIDKARTLLLELAGKHPDAVGIAHCRVIALVDAGAVMTLTMWCADPLKVPDVKSDILEAARNRFDADGIKITTAGSVPR